MKGKKKKRSAKEVGLFLHVFRFRNGNETCLLKTTQNFNRAVKQETCRKFFYVFSYKILKGWH